MYMQSQTGREIAARKDSFPENIGSLSAGRRPRRNVDMANTKSAKKAARQAERRTEINKSRRSRLKTYVRKVEEAIAAGDKEAAGVALREAQPEIQRSASKGIIHKNTAARKISRLSQRIKALGAAA
jgi:small subunit ribosomal protein S20